MDINDYSKEKNQNYYIGTLVVFEKERGEFETIDGQQRLTTLSILLSVLKNEFNMDISFKHLLSYESREISTKTLEYIYKGEISDKENINSFMEDAFKNLKNILSKQVENTKDFTNYLLNNVIVLRVEVPKDTDLNHYFEIMNNRGEQLEKHEVLKANMLSQLDYNERKIFNIIWEACSDMNRYIQYGFTPSQRDEIFGINWNCFKVESFEDFEEIFEKIFIEEEKYLDIDTILNDFNKQDIEKNENEEKPDRFLSTINFQNFLLHVYKITKDIKIPLDDKKLLELIEYKDKEFVKSFCVNILKIRFLFDSYVIKRAFLQAQDEWSLKKAYKYKDKNKNNKHSLQYKNSFEDENINKQILMILSMFHVSNPSQNYKYWLNGVLNILYKNIDIDGEEYLKKLENLAKKFLKNIYLAKTPQKFGH